MFKEFHRKWAAKKNAGSDAANWQRAGIEFAKLIRKEMDSLEKVGAKEY